MKGHEQPAIVNTNSQDETSASDIIGFGVRDNRGGGARVLESARFINPISGAHPLHGLTFPQTATRL